VFNYHKLAHDKGAGYPACIRLAEFVYTYMHANLSLWKRSFIHKMLKELIKAKHLNTEIDEYKRSVFSVSDEVAVLLRDKDGTWVSFGLQLACESTIYIAIVSRFLLHVIDNSPDGIAYNLDVKEMSKVNCISVPEIYRTIAGLEKLNVFKRVRSPLKRHSRGLHLTKVSAK